MSHGVMCFSVAVLPTYDKEEGSKSPSAGHQNDVQTKWWLLNWIIMLLATIWSSFFDIAL